MNIVGIFISKFLKIKLIYSLLGELYPEIAEKINRIKSKFILSIVRAIDTFALKSADSSSS